MSGTIRTTTAPKELLDKIDEMIEIRRHLTIEECAKTSRYGLYIRVDLAPYISFDQPGDSVRYTVGGRLIAKLMFVRNADGTRIVTKYRPGDWECRVDPTLSLCKELWQVSKEASEWADEELEAYQANENLDSALVGRIHDIEQIREQHYEELNSLWHKTDSSKRLELARCFRQELEKEWPTEFSEITRTMGLLNVTIPQLLTRDIEETFLVGLMAGKGWITQDDLSDFCLWLGDGLVKHVRSVLKEAKSRGIAFAGAFAGVAAQGTIIASQEATQASEPSKHEVFEEILLTEGTNLLRREHDNLGILGEPRMSIDPFNPTDGQYLSETVLGSRHFEVERFERILKKLLGKDYKRLYQVAKEQVISRR